MNNPILIALGWLCVILAIIGSVLPLVPAFPFVFLAAYLFAKGNQKVHDWFIKTKLYKHNFETYVNGRSLRVKTKLLIILGVSFTSIYGYFICHHFKIDFGKPLMILIWFSNFIYFGFIVKNVKTL